MKPPNVVSCKNYFAFPDSGDSENGRYDGCLTRDDGAGVWSPASGIWWPVDNLEAALRIANHMANYYAEFYREPRPFR